MKPKRFLVLPKLCSVIMCFWAMFFLLVGCDRTTEYEFMHDTSEISMIEIVQIKEKQIIHEELEVYNWEVLGGVDDKSAFMKELIEIPCYSYFTHPCEIYTGLMVIRIEYNNGDYELLGDFGERAEYSHEDKSYKNYCGYFYFDNQFDALISKYIEQIDSHINVDD